MNSKDPLASAPDRARMIFGELSKVCSGFSADDVTVATINLLIQVVRQNRAKRADAERLWDDMTAKGKHVLLDQHYDNTGRRKGVYPFHQVVEQIEHVHNLSKLRGF